MRAQVGALRQEVARLQLLLQASEAKVAMWEECMQQLVHCVMLSPDMNDMYKTECTTLLRDTLKGVEQISAVRFVDCSFPSVPSEVRAPSPPHDCPTGAAPISRDARTSLPPTHRRHTYS